MNNPESYQPTPDEIKKAEEMMTLKQKGMSEARDEYHEKRDEEDMEIPDDFKFSSDGENVGGTYNLSGNFKGHHFELASVTTYREDRADLRAKGNVFGSRVTGTVDGKPLSSEESSRLWKKFIPIAVSLEAEKDETIRRWEEFEQKESDEQARKTLEQKRSGIEDILKDFGV